MTKVLTIVSLGSVAEVDLPLEQGLASIVASAAVTNTETVIAQTPVIDANTLIAGSVFRVRLSGVFTQTGTAATTSNFRIRFGPNGTTADTQVVLMASASNAAASTNIGFAVEFLVTVRSIGAGGTVIGSSVLTNNATVGVSSTTNRVSPTAAAPTAVALNTTVANRLSLTVQSGATTSTITISQAVIEQVR